MSVKDYKIIHFVTYLTSIFIFFALLIFIDINGGIYGISDTLLPILFIIISLLLSILPSLIFTFYLKKYGLDEEIIDVEKNLSNFENTFKEYLLEDFYEIIKKKDLNMNIYEKNINKRITRFFVINSTEFLNKDIDFKQYIQSIRKTLENEIITKKNNETFYNNYIIIVADELNNYLREILICNTYVKPLSIRVEDQNQFLLGSCVFPTIICKKDNTIYFSKFYEAPFFIDKRRKYIAKLIKDIYRCE